MGIRLLCYYSAEWYEEPFLELRNHYDDLNEVEFANIVSQYREMFTSRRYSALHLLAFTLDTATHAMAIVLNEHNQHPQKQRTIINPKARELQKNRPTLKKAFLAGGNPAEAVMQQLGAQAGFADNFAHNEDDE